MQISKINSISQNKNTNPNFKGDLSWPLAGKLADFAESHSNVNVGIKMFADVVEFETKKGLQVLLRDLPEAEESLGHNANLMYIDSVTGTSGAEKVFLSTAQSAQEIYMSLAKSLRDAIPDSFLR